MATIDLGKIKFKWQGTYAGGTAYVPDDVVYYMDGSVGSSYMCVANTTGNAPSSGGTLHASWQYLAKGQAVSPTTTQGDLIVRGASADGRLAIGSAGQALKVNSSANGLEYGAGGGVLQIKETISASHYSINPADYAMANAAFKVDITATSTTSHFILECFMGTGCETHDDMFTANWFDSLKGTASADILFAEATGGGSRQNGVFPLFPAGAAVSSGWDEYWFSGQYFTAKYYPDSGQRSTSARSFYPCFKRNGHASAIMYINYGKANHAYNFIGKSVIRVTEIAGEVT